MDNLKDKTNTQLQKEKKAVCAEIQRREWKLRNEENSAMVGKCFRYWNGYNSEESWWLYVKVITAESGGLRLFSFQQDINGKISIEPYEFHSSLSDSYKQIPQKKFIKAWNRLLSKFGPFTSNLSYD